MVAVQLQKWFRSTMAWTLLEGVALQHQNRAGTYNISAYAWPPLGMFLKAS